MEQGVLGIVPACAIEGVDRLGEPIGPLVAPSQGEGDAGVAGPQARGHLEGLQGLAVALQRPQGLPLEEAGLELHRGPFGPALEDLQRMPGKLEHQVAFGFVQFLADPVADDPTHR